jgi:hypothetical protein
VVPHLHTAQHNTARTLGGRVLLSVLPHETHDACSTSGWLVFRLKVVLTNADAQPTCKLKQGVPR